MPKLDINRKILPVGSVCFFVNKYAKHPVTRNSQWRVEFGTVEEHYPDVIAIQLYEPKDMRTVNGVPIKDFETPTPWRKLPKGWSYDTRLWEEGFIPYPREDYDLKTEEGILAAISDGVFVKVQDNEHSRIESEIDNNKGYRLIKKYDTPMYWTSENFREVYATYEEAEKVVAEHDAQLAAIAAMSDLEWSVYEIDQTLNHWAAIYHVSDYEKEKIRNFLMELDNLEDVDVRSFSGRIEWKYWKNKRWNSINV